MEKDSFSVKNILLNADKSEQTKIVENKREIEEKQKDFDSKSHIVHKPKPIRPIIDVPFGCSSFYYDIPEIGNVDMGNRRNHFEYRNETCEKRKRSWSRAVFSNLQRKGLERQFEVQKYITKPDRKKLAQRLNLSDSQVKVWFQNRRMKERHRRNSILKNDKALTQKCEKNNESEEEIDVLKD